MRLRITAVLLLFLLSLPSCGGSEETTLKQSGVSERARLDISAVTQLLDVLDLLVRKNPEYRAIITRLRRTLPDSARKELQQLVSRNAEDPEIKTAIDKLLNTPAYQLYYTQYRNVTPVVHRDILCALPYTAINSPADIAANLLELCENLDSVRAWVANVISHVDLTKSQETALQWLPPGDHTLPPIRFFYDGNGDAFARGGEIGFDVLGVVLSKRPDETRFASLGSEGVDRIESVLAHELHHVYATQYLYPPGLKYDTWQDQWRGRLICQIVKEGVAMQCDVRPGLRQTLMEDTATARYWIGQLNGKLAALRSDGITEPQMQAWFDSSFNEAPRVLLEDYRKRVSPTADSATFMRQNQINRPMIVYTLGWWMVGRIAEGGKNRDAVIRLLVEPESLYPRYNQSTRNIGDGLTVHL